MSMHAQPSILSYPLFDLLTVLRYMTILIMARMESGDTPSTFPTWEWERDIDSEEEEEDAARGWRQVVGEERGEEEEEEEEWLCEMEAASKKSLTWREIMVR